MGSVRGQHWVTQRAGLWEIPMAMSLGSQRGDCLGHPLEKSLAKKRGCWMELSWVPPSVDCWD